MKYHIKNMTSKRCLQAIGRKENAPISGVWTENYNEARQYSKSEAKELRDSLNRAYGHGSSLNIEAVIEKA